MLFRSNGKRFKGMTNVGRRPSFKNKNSRVNIEVHIFDFKKRLYGEEIIVEFIKKIRHEQVFDSSARMNAQLKRDEAKSRLILSTL